MVRVQRTVLRERGRLSPKEDGGQDLNNDEEEREETHHYEAFRAILDCLSHGHRPLHRDCGSGAGVDSKLRDREQVQQQRQTGDVSGDHSLSWPV